MAVLAALLATSIPLSYLTGLEEGVEIEQRERPTEFVLAIHETQPGEVLASPPDLQGEAPHRPPNLAVMCGMYSGT